MWPIPFLAIPAPSAPALLATRSALLLGGGPRPPQCALCRSAAVAAAVPVGVECVKWGDLRFRPPYFAALPPYLSSRAANTYAGSRGAAPGEIFACGGFIEVIREPATVPRAVFSATLASSVESLASSVTLRRVTEDYK